MNPDQHREAILLLGCPSYPFDLPFDFATVTVIIPFIISAIG